MACRRGISCVSTVGSRMHHSVTNWPQSAKWRIFEARWPRTVPYTPYAMPKNAKGSPSRSTNMIALMNFSSSRHTRYCPGNSIGQCSALKVCLRREGTNSRIPAGDVQPWKFPQPMSQR
eukprot:100308-Rhodomonas_salina.2